MTIHVVMSCDSVTTEAAKTYRISKDLKESKDENIINYVKYVKKHRVCITAASCFEINRKTILSLLDIVTNYLIVILQFNGVYFH